MEGMSGARAGMVGTTGTTTSHTGAVPPTGNTTTGAGASYQQPGAHHVDMHGAGIGGTGNRGNTAYDTTHNPSTYSNNGPHSSKVGNMLDPRVDSTTVQPNTSTGYSNHPSSNVTAGPHSSNTMNRLDPRADSQSGYTTNTGGNNAGYGGNVGGGTTAAHDEFANNPNSTNAGPHSSNLMNKLDPRVDSITGYANNAGVGRSNRY